MPPVSDYLPAYAGRRGLPDRFGLFEGKYPRGPEPFFVVAAAGFAAAAGAGGAGGNPFGVASTFSVCRVNF